VSLPTAYAETVLDLVDRIPAGRVLSYGDVAELLGTGSARTVGMVLARWGSAVAWHRVVRADGSAAPVVRTRQLALLTAERTAFAAADRVDLTAARWSPSGSPPNSGLTAGLTRSR
jgi:alkylated DNA nucleotide flippase Atl1